MEYNGYTDVLTARSALLESGKTYNVKIAICDAGDLGDDLVSTAAFIKKDSLEFITGTHLKINCGGSAVGSFAADQYYSSGTSTGSTSGSIDMDALAYPRPQESVLQSDRNKYNSTSGITYTIPVDTGIEYTVKLYFSDNFWFSSGEQVFDIKINGTNIVNNYDIISEAGSSETAVTYTITDVDPNGSGDIVIFLDPELSSGTYDASINAIEIIPQ